MSYVADGPDGGERSSWNFAQPYPSIAACRINFPQANTVAQFTDRDYTVGLWVKFTTFPTNTSTANNRLIQTGAGSASVDSGFTVNVAGTGAGTNARKISLLVSNGSSYTATYGPTWPTDDKWHYLAARRVNTNIEVYFDGALIITGTNPVTAAASGIGFGGISAFNSSAWAARYSHLHLGTSTSYDATAIAAIYAAGNSGFRAATNALPTLPKNWWSADEGTSDILANYGTDGAGATQNEFNLSGVSPTAFAWITGEVEKGIEFKSAWAGWDTNPSWTPTPSGSGQMTLNFWFKKSAPPTTAQNWIYRYYNANDNIDSSNEAGIQTNGYLQFRPTWGYSGGPYAQSEVTTQMNVCDGNWHMITITYETASLVGTMRMYVDGVLKDTKADWGNSSSNSPASFSFGAQNTSWDEFQTYGYKLTDAQILSLYQSEYPAASSYPLKYWNGSSWATPISMKQWNGSAWVTMVGKVYNGTSFVSIS